MQESGVPPGHSVFLHVNPWTWDANGNRIEITYVSGQSNPEQTKDSPSCPVYNKYK
jgi:hypothetical protein